MSHVIPALRMLTGWCAGGAEQVAEPNTMQTCWARWNDSRGTSTGCPDTVSLPDTTSFSTNKTVNPVE